MSEGEVRVKSKQEYSRNVKKLKVKLLSVREQAAGLRGRVQALTRMSSDKLIAMKMARFCKERRFTPEMLFRFADRQGKGQVGKVEFKEALLGMGLRLTKDEIMRLEYLIDEDLSGAISWDEFNGYLDAFGIKKEFTGESKVKEAMQNLDLNKMLPQVENGAKGDKKKQVNLLSYEDFVKYCHKNCKEMKDRQIAGIFQRLQRNQLLNLQHFLDYLQDQREQQRKVAEINRNKLKRGESLVRDEAAQKRAQSLKGLVQALFRSRAKNAGPTFHSTEFIRLERLLNRPRGELTGIFKQIDGKRKVNAGTAFRGSFGYNELINYYIEKEAKGAELVYAFELMGAKLAIDKHAPEAVMAQYTKAEGVMAEEEFRRFMRDEFEVEDREYDTISKLVPREQGRIAVARLVELMRMELAKGLVYIRPSLPAARLVFRSALMALRCCLQLQDKLAKAKVKEWNDPDFGPTQLDSSGQESIQLPLPTEQFLWKRTSELGMLQFYERGAAAQGTGAGGIACPHELLGRSIWSLARSDQSWVYPVTKPNPEAREVGEAELGHLFTGVYPYAFHPFAKYGIFVLRVWVEQRWRYVVMDNKLPCGLDGKPFFSAAPNCRLGFVSLLEKALAKAHGSYKAMFAVGATQRYLMELTGALCLDEALGVAMPQDARDAVWAELLWAFRPEKQRRATQAQVSTVRDIFFGMFKGHKEGINANFPSNFPLKLSYALQIANPAKKNRHKSHRLVLLKPTQALASEKEWNRGWCRSLADNKFEKNIRTIPQPCSKLLADPGMTLLNYKLLRQGFNLLKLRRVDWQISIILRKQLEFEEKHRCRYEVTAKSADLELVVFLRRRSCEEQARVGLEVKGSVEGKEAVVGHAVFKEEVSVYSVKFEKDKTVALELFVDNWNNDHQYVYELTFYLSHPRFELKQRDRHMLFRYVSPLEEDAKQDWKDFTKEEQMFVQRNFYKAADKRGCCGCL